MSDTRPEYGDWRQAGDGKWYPPSNTSAAGSEDSPQGVTGAGWRNHPDTGELRFWDGEAWGVTARQYLGDETPSAALAVADSGGPSVAGSGWFADTADSMRFWNGSDWEGESRPITLPPTPWGSWTWPDGSGIDLGSLPQPEAKNRMIAGFLGLCGGAVGLHKFYLDQRDVGVRRVLIATVGGVFTCAVATLAMWVTGIAEGVIYMAKSDAEFYWTYVAQKKEWF